MPERMEDMSRPSSPPAHATPATAPGVPPDPRDILILNLGQLGDTVLSLPAMAAVRRRFPRARIAVAAGIAPGQAIAMSGFADRIIPVDRVALRDGPKLQSIARVIKLAAQLRRERFDLVIDLRSFWETNLLGWISGAPARLFANRGGRSIDLLANIRTAREDRTRHLVDRYLDVVTPLGIGEVSRVPHLAPRNEDREAAAQFLQSAGAAGDRPLVGFFPGAGHPLRCWPLARFAEVAAHLEQSSGTRSVVFLGPEEHGMAEAAHSQFPAGTILVEGRTLSQFAALAEHLTMLVSNDTGPMHVAAAVGTPVVVVVGPQHPESLLFIPIGEQHRVVIRPAILQITSADVYSAAHGLLSAHTVKSRS
jgi:ADP-heptose:LPS heptosyltransferase